MFKRLFGRQRQANRAITEALYGRIVAAARQSVFYSDWDVPDTPLGRFEMLSLHMFLFQRRMLGGEAAAQALSQALIDEFFLDIDHSLRELGVGDVGVPRRMKKLAKMFYGRTAAYADSLDRGDLASLAAALHRNVRPEAEDWPQAGYLAGYAARAAEELAAQPAEAIQAGTLSFPAAGAA